MEIFIEASLNTDCRNTRRANICLHSRVLQSWNFQGASTFAGATWLRIYRSRLRVFVPCMCQRLTDFQRALLTGSTGGETGTLSLLLQSFSTSKKYFLFRRLRSDLTVNWCMRELVYVTFERYEIQHCNYLPNNSHASTNDWFQYEVDRREYILFHIKCH